MSVVTLSKRSHTVPDQYRVQYPDAAKVLLPKATVPTNDALPVIRSKLKVAVIGAGFSGLAALMMIQNKLKTDDYVVFDRVKGVGGTWWMNTYPGCLLDVPALLYLFSNELCLNWSLPQPIYHEMQTYISDVVDKHDLRRHIQLEKAVTKAEWKDDHWEMHIRDMNTGQLTIHTAKIVINGTGGLVYPNEFKAPGLDKFKGTYMHLAVFDHRVPLKGKKIIVIGNGCLATQLIPATLAEYDPASITQVVRSQHWILPPVPHHLHVLYMWMARWGYWGLWFVRNLVAVLLDMRFPMFKGDGWWARFLRRATTKRNLQYMTSECPKEYQDILIPNFKVGCKRLIFDRGYLKSLHDPRVDVKLGQIAEVKEKLVVLTDGSEHEADVIIACTGYDIPRNLRQIQVIGEDGENVAKMWDREGASAYETLMVKNVPNYFALVGPNAGTGHFSVVTAIENGCEFVAKVLKRILDEGVSVRVKPEKYEEWKDTVQKELKNCVYGTEFGGCKSWYTENGHNATAYPWLQYVYYKRTHNPQWKDMIFKKDCDLCSKEKKE